MAALNASPSPNESKVGTSRTAGALLDSEEGGTAIGDFTARRARGERQRQKQESGEFGRFCFHDCFPFPLCG